MGRVLDNPRTGERIVIRCSGTETDGQVLMFDLYLQPGGHVPAGHTHPNQEERFTIEAGRLRFRMQGCTTVAHAGDVLVVPPRTPHWFGNIGDTVAHVRVEVRPALRMEQLFEQASTRGWSRLARLAIIPLQFRAEVRPDLRFFLGRWLRPLVAR